MTTIYKNCHKTGAAVCSAVCDLDVHVLERITAVIGLVVLCKHDVSKSLF